MSQHSFIIVDEINDAAQILDAMRAITERVVAAIALPTDLAVLVPPKTETEVRHRLSEYVTRGVDYSRSPSSIGILAIDQIAPRRSAQEERKRRRDNFRIYHGHHLPKRLRGRFAGKETQEHS